MTTNLWQEVGLCNGAAGTVHQILYCDDHQPPDLPVAVLICFDTYAGPSFIPSLPSVLPIPPITFEWAVETQKLYLDNSSHFSYVMLLLYTSARVKLSKRLLLTSANQN